MDIYLQFKDKYQNLLLYLQVVIIFTRSYYYVTIIDNQIVTMDNKSKILGELVKNSVNTENCGVTIALNLLSGKWKTAIIYLISLDVNRFGQLQKMIPECSKRMMTSRLRELERDGIIHREVFAQVPPKVIYTLTPKGEKLKPVFNELKKWGNENFL